MNDRVPADQRDRQDEARRRRQTTGGGGSVHAPDLGTFADLGVWLSAELRSNGWPPSEVARRAQAVGAKWACIDLAVNETGDYNLNVFVDLAAALDKAGVFLGGWGHNPDPVSVANRVHLAGAPFYIINREAPDQTDPGFLDRLRKLCARVELAVVAGPFDAFPNPELDPGGWEAETKPWLDLPMLVEAYTGENPQATPAAQAFQAKQRGFEKRACVVESNVGHGWTLDRIDPAEVRSVFGRAVSLYMLGTASDADLAKFARMATL